MQSLATSLDGVLLIEPAVYRDERGFFLESWNRREFAAATGMTAEFVQDNVSGSRSGVVRGLHYQLPPHPQGKLVRASVGTVFDVAVDLRRSSSTFGQWFGVELSAMNQRQLWIPPGFGHGFLTTSDWAEVNYKTTDYYSRSSERVVRWDDPDIAIEWPLEGRPALLSEKDAAASGLRDAEVFT